MVKKKRTFKEEEICELAKKYVRRVDFKNAHNNAYRQAIKLGIIAKLFPTVWNIDKGARRYLVPKEKIISDAKKCKNRTQLKRKYFASYRSAKKLGLLDCLFKKGEK